MKITQENYHLIPDGLRSLSHATQKDFDFLPRLVGNQDKFLGTRLPEIKTLARQLLKDNSPEELFSLIIKNWQWHEEKLLADDLLGMTRDVNQQIKLLDDFLPLIDSWDVCDSLVCRLRPSIRKNHGIWWNKAISLIKSPNPWHIRLGLVISMDYYKDYSCLRELLGQLENLNKTLLEKNYYLQMGIAWTLATYYLTFPQEIIEFVSNKNNLDRWTRRKTLTKAVESRLVPEPTKKELRKLRDTL